MTVELTSIHSVILLPVDFSTIQDVRMELKKELPSWLGNIVCCGIVTISLSKIQMVTNQNIK